MMSELQAIRLASPYVFTMESVRTFVWSFVLHDFWCQVAIVAALVTVPPWRLIKLGIDHNLVDWKELRS